MKTIFHDNESGTKLEMEGTFASSKAQLVDNEGNVTAELEGSYSEILEMISQLSENSEKEKEEPQELCEDIDEDEENITNEQKNIQPDELFVVNNDEMEYYSNFDKGEIVKFLYHKDIGLPLMFKNSEGYEQALRFEDVTLLKSQEGNSRKFDFCAKNNILFTKDTSLKGTKVNLTKDSVWIEDDGSLIIDIDCEDGLPYVKSNDSGYGAFVDLSKLKLRTKEYTQSLEIGDYVKVKEGKEYGGAKGFAIVTNIEDDNVRLKGIDVNSDYRETWINSVDNVIKIG